VYQVPSQRGKLIVVTGANSGTGLEVTRRLAAAGAEVIMAVRNQEKGDTARDDLLAQLPDARLEVRILDVADLSSVAHFAQSLTDEGKPLNVLINNAGVMVPPTRFETVDGFELQMGTNFLGAFALTLRLLPLMLTADDARVSTMSSFAASFGRIHFDDLEWTHHYRASSAYSQSKLADLLFTLRLAEIAREREWPLMSNAAHPGYTRTNLMTAGASLGQSKTRRAWVNRAAHFVSQGVEQGAEPLLYGATSPDALSGIYYGPSRVIVGPTTIAAPPRAARDREVGERLFSLAEELTGVSLPS
jgi:NAD(P)-dependent dehydrogenase (short-subunit alcohol dehydrogenase family)